MPNLYQVGIIGRTGQGDYGHGLDLAFADIPNVKVMAVADADPEGLQAAGQRTGAERLYPDYHEMLAQESLDLVSVAPRWVDCHREMVLACAEAGVKGILCEKPLATTLEEADAMLAACERNGVRLAVAHRRTSAYEQHAKKLVDAGLIGKIKLLRGRGKGDHRSGGTDLIVLGTHILESMRYFAGADVDWAMGHVSQDDREAIASDAYDGIEGVGLVAGDSLSAYYVFKNGVKAHFESYPIPSSGSHTNSRWFGFEVYGTEGILSVRNAPLGELYLYRNGMWMADETEIQWERLHLNDWDNRSDGQPRSEKEQMHLSNQMIVTELIESIEANRDVVAASSGYDARAALEMVMAVHESHRLRSRVSFPLENRKNPYQTWLGSEQ